MLEIFLAFFAVFVIGSLALVMLKSAKSMAD